MDLQFGFAYVVTYVITYAVTYGTILYVIVYVIAHVIAYVITCVIAFTYAWTGNIKMRLYMHLRTYQPPLPNTYQASAWSYKYIGRWMCKPKFPLPDYINTPS